LNVIEVEFVGDVFGDSVNDGGGSVLAANATATTPPPPARTRTLSNARNGLRRAFLAVLRTNRVT
jgi:hypothetical protein